MRGWSVSILAPREAGMEELRSVTEAIAELLEERLDAECEISFGSPEAEVRSVAPRAKARKERADAEQS